MTYKQIDPGMCAAAVLLLGVGAALMVVAQRRGWRPPLAAAIYTAVTLRLVMLALAYHLQPRDFAIDFQRVGFETLHHHDPILATQAVRWSYLPVYDFPLAGAYWAHVHFHISWLLTARVPSILCDLGVVVLVGVVAGAVGQPAALRRFQYACNPLAILVSAVHGQVDPACLLFSFAAFALVLRSGTRISGRATAAAGILLGLGIGAKTWPVLFAPALLLALPSARRRWQFAAATVGTVGLLFVSMPLTVGTPVNKLFHLAKIMTSYHPPIGNWGWAGMWVALHPTKLSTTHDPLWINVGSTGAKLAVVGALLAVWWWRRGHPLDVATATTTALIVITPAFGMQYLLWQAPSSTAYPTRLSLPLQIVLGAYAAVFYLPMSMLSYYYWRLADHLMMLISLGVIALMIAALPWGRRVWQRSQPRLPLPQRSPDPATA
jgi:Glycosyltransferase family 87